MPAVRSPSPAIDAAGIQTHHTTAPIPPASAAQLFTAIRLPATAQAYPPPRQFSPLPTGRAPTLAGSALFFCAHGPRDCQRRRSKNRQVQGTDSGTYHGHGGHEHDTTLLTSKDTSNPGVRITRIGLYISPLHSPRRLKLTSRLVNLALVFIKAAAGVLLHSSSLLADAGHSAADILSDILTLSTITFSSREPTLTYPLGFGKVETLGAIGVSSLLRISPAPAHKASLIPLWRHR